MACVAVVTLVGVLALPRVVERTRLSAEAFVLQMQIRHAVVEVELPEIGDVGRVGDGRGRGEAYEGDWQDGPTGAADGTDTSAMNTVNALHEKAYELPVVRPSMTISVGSAAARFGESKVTLIILSNPSISPSPTRPSL